MAAQLGVGAADAGERIDFSGGIGERIGCAVAGAAGATVETAA